MIRPRLTAKIARIKISVATLRPNGGEHDRQREEEHREYQDAGPGYAAENPPHVATLLPKSPEGLMRSTTAMSRKTITSESEGK